METDHSRIEPQSGQESGLFLDAVTFARVL